MKITINGIRRDATPEEEAAILAQREIDNEPTPEPMRPLTRRQLRMALYYEGFTSSDIVASINAIQDPDERELALIEWEDATVYQRDHPLMVTVASDLGLTEAQVDVLWRNAQDTF